MLQSLAVSNAVHFSRWVDCSPETRRTLLIPLIRSQRPVIIQVATFEANLATFATVSKSTFVFHGQEKEQKKFSIEKFVLSKLNIFPEQSEFSIHFFPYEN